MAAFKCMDAVDPGIRGDVSSHSSAKGQTGVAAVSKQENQGPWQQLSVPRNKKLTGNASALEISTPNT